jgi:uncharacterized protein YhaN
MKLRKIAIRRMPGFENEGFELVEFTDGLNVVYGPNGSGKTTTCNAIRGLLWPKTLADRSPVSIVSEWIEDGRSIRMEIEGDRLTSQQDGIPIETTGIPAEHLSGCFTVTVDELFGGSATDKDLATRVSRQMTAGYDLKTARDMPLLKLKKTHGRDEFVAFKKAKETVRGIESEHEKLRGDEARLDGLEREEENARSAQAKITRIEDAQRLLENRNELLQERTELERFPNGLQHLLGNEESDLRKIEEDLDTHTQRLSEAEEEARVAAEMITELSLPDEAITEDRLAEQRVKLGDLREAEKTLEKERRELEAADRRTTDGLKRLGSSVSQDKLDNLDVPGLDAIDEFHRQSEFLKSQKQADEAMLEALGPAARCDNAEDLSNGINILTQWQGEAQSDTKAPILPKLPILIPAVALVVISVVLTFLQNPLWLLLLLPAAPGIWLGSSLFRKSKHDPAAVLKRQYSMLGIDPPARWERDAVLTHLKGLIDLLAEARRAQKDDGKRDECRQHLQQLKNEELRVEARRNQLIEQFGVAPNTSDLALVNLAANLRSYQEAGTNREIHAKSLAAAEKVRGEILVALNAFFGELGEEACDSSSLADVRLGAITERIGKHRQAQTRLSNAEKNAADATAQIETQKQRKSDLYAGIGLENGDREGLLSMVTQLENYREMESKISSLELQESNCLMKLGDDSGLTDLEYPELERRKASLRRQEDNYRSLVEEIRDIRSKIEAAMGDTQLEDAVAAVEDARAELAARREESLLSEAGLFLLGEIDAEYRIEGMPAVVQQADRYFRLFTRGRFELRVDHSDDHDVSFMALDTAKNQGKHLHELSRGEFMQLLLAVRIAFAETAEGDTTVPFVFDEVLCSSDPERYRAILESLMALVREGRQVLYFTCQPGDAAAWKTISEELSMADSYRLFELGRIGPRGGNGDIPLWESAVKEPSVPKPGGVTMEEYARLLEVPALNPSAGSGAIHMAHLLESPKVLYRVLSAGLETFGQLDSLARLGGYAAYLETEDLERIRAKALVVDTFAETWKIGRGKPISRQVLLDAGVSKRILDRVTGLAEDCGWNARRLIEAMTGRDDDRAKNIHETTIVSLEEYLLEKGHLDLEKILTEEEIRVRVLSAANEVVDNGRISSHEIRALVTTLYRAANVSALGV